MNERWGEGDMGSPAGISPWRMGEGQVDHERDAPRLELHRVRHGRQHLLTTIINRQHHHYPSSIILLIINNISIIIT
jgi:hypothetical protein